MRAEQHPGSLSGLSDDQLATASVSLVVGELEWTPDVAPEVMDRISRDAVAYPEQFDRRMVPPAPAQPSASAARSAKRTLGRLAVFGVLLAVLIALVVLAATANGAAIGFAQGDRGGDDVDADVPRVRVASVPNSVNDGTLVVGGGQNFYVVTEAS